MTISRQEREFYRTFSQHGSGEAQVTIEPKEIILLGCILCIDLNLDIPERFVNSYKPIAMKGFYNISAEEVQLLPDAGEEDAVSFLKQIRVFNPSDISYLYLKVLSELYRRRNKYSRILQTQPFPQIDQIGPRFLLEYGKCNNKLLISWAYWRKWAFDIDNRSAQETGYLFEPILASCLGGESLSAKHSVVKRLDEAGNQTNEGRQVDCYIKDLHEVYELKLRVTIAASGQGRFKEECSFPREAAAAGMTPILVVFDPTPSTLLTQLKKSYAEAGGHSAIGPDAWRLLKEKAGNEMGYFIENYIKPPIEEADSMATDLPDNLMLEVENSAITIKDASGNNYRITRL